MTDRLDEEIRSTLGSMIAEAPEPMELDQLAMQAAIATVPRQRRSPVTVIAVAFATVVVVVGAISLLASPRDDGAVPLTTIPDDAPVTATTPPPDLLSSSSWTQVPHDEAVFGGEMEAVFGGASMNSVTVGGPGLVAVGSANSAPAVWTSVDGITWSRVPHNEAVGGGSMSSVTSGGPGLVAVGSFEPNAAVWTSADGVTWSRVSHDEAVFGGEMGAGAIFGGATMNSVTVGGPGLVAVGFDGSPDGGGDAAVWTSVDGITWSRVPHDEAVFGGEDDGYYGQGMASVAAGGPGLVAVGWDWLGAVVWTSPDGIAWSRVPHSEAVFGGASMKSVTAGGPGLVAVGSQDLDAAVWTSPDGIAWSRVSHDGVFGGATMNSVAVAGPGLVAVGGSGPAEGGSCITTAVSSCSGRAKVWISDDGIRWSRVPSEAVGNGFMRAVIVRGSVLISVGGSGSHAAVWVSRD